MNPFPAGHRFLHHCPYRVIYRDTDLAGHVYYANYLAFFEIGRGAYLRDLGANYKEWEARGYMLPVRACWSDYLIPARYDDVLTIETRLASLSKAQIGFAYRVLRHRDGVEEVCCSGGTRHPFMRKADWSISRDGLKLMAELGIDAADIPKEFLEGNGKSPAKDRA